MREKAAILLFHRVDDRFPGDPLTCSRRAFARYCAFLRRYYDVIPLKRLVHKLRTGDDLSATVVITFDDGYRDNYEVAASELQRHGLPATFFIATEFIESTTIPWWDAHLPFASEWMTWDQVRELDAAGFEVGAHTQNHVDLGLVGPNEAWREIIGSRERIARETGRVPDSFSYPYGRRHQITEANRDLVRKAGFSVCLSAYGGAVSPHTELYNVQRMPISPWFESPGEVGLEMARLPQVVAARNDAGHMDYRGTRPPPTAGDDRSTFP